MNAKKEAKIDLLIFLLSALIPATIYLCFESSWRGLNENNQNNFFEVFFIQSLLSFCLARLGLVIVMILRKETFASYSLVKKNILPSIIFSTLAFVPHLFFFVKNPRVSWL